MSRRGLTIIDQIRLMSMRGKITLLVLSVVLVSFVGTFSYMSLAKETEVEAPALAQEENTIKPPLNIVKVDPSSIIFTNEIDDENTVANEVEDEEEEENKVEKEITYKGKTVTVPKAEVAPVNSAEDAQTQKTGGEEISAEEAVSKFENDGQSAGIDVSAHQGVIDWAQVKASGIEFAMIRVGFRGYTEGGIYEDACFKANINGAVKNGVMVGVYFYSVAINEEEALQEAAWLVERIKSYRITYPVVYDFEDFTRGRTAGISGSQATANARTFLNYVSSKGYTPMMYANKNDITSRFDKSSLGYKFWLAHYTQSTDYTGSYQMWQYTSSGSVPGISGRVDMNVAYFRYGAVAEPKHTHDFNNGTEIASKTVPATCTTDGEVYIRCKDCSDNEKRILQATGHKWGEYKLTTPPTESAEGEKTRECSLCHEKETIKVDKLKPSNTSKPCEHDFEIKEKKAATCETPGSVTKQCKKCKATVTDNVPATGHTASEFQVVTPATTASAGTEAKECTKCHKVLETREIPKLEAPVESDPTPETPGESEEGGETPPAPPTGSEGEVPTTPTDETTSDGAE